VSLACASSRWFANLAYQHEREQDRKRQQYVQGAARKVHPEVADGLGALAREAANPD
jgi:hypothetical protein